MLEEPAPSDLSGLDEDVDIVCAHPDGIVCRPRPIEGRPIPPSRTGVFEIPLPPAEAVECAWPRSKPALLEAASALASALGCSAQERLDWMGSLSDGNGRRRLVRHLLAEAHSKAGVRAALVALLRACARRRP